MMSLEKGWIKIEAIEKELLLFQKRYTTLFRDSNISLSFSLDVTTKISLLNCDIYVSFCK